MEEAIACYRRALELNPQRAEVHDFLGNALKKQGNPEAVACYRRAVELKPEFVEARGNLGASLEEAGDFRGAEDCFRTALRHNGRFVFAHYKLAELLGGKHPAGDLARLRRLLEGTGPSDSDRLLLHFGLARVLDAQGEYAEAVEHLDRGNSLQQSEWRKRGQEYDPREFELLVTRMIAVSAADFFERVRGFGLESELPVFVVGLPRSGTTLVEQILASHPQVCGAGEIKLTQDTVAALRSEGPESSWPGVTSPGNRPAWSSMRRNGLSERPASSRCATDLQDLGGKMETLPAGIGSAVGAAGRRPRHGGRNARQPGRTVPDAHDLGRRGNNCRLSLRERCGFRGAKGNNATVIDSPVLRGLPLRRCDPIFPCVTPNRSYLLFLQPDLYWGLSIVKLFLLTAGVGKLRTCPNRGGFA
jgi:tetratricopeptide (TPR) repeat protein